MALLHLKENEIESLEVTDPFVEGEVEEEKETHYTYPEEPCRQIMP